jgi:hypothetical protein
MLFWYFFKCETECKLLHLFSSLMISAKQPEYMIKQGGENMSLKFIYLIYM